MQIWIQLGPKIFDSDWVAISQILWFSELYYVLAYWLTVHTGFWALPLPSLLLQVPPSWETSLLIEGGEGEHRCEISVFISTVFKDFSIYYISFKRFLHRVGCFYYYYFPSYLLQVQLRNVSVNWGWRGSTQVWNIQGVEVNRYWCAVVCRYLQFQIEIETSYEYQAGAEEIW